MMPWSVLLTLALLCSNALAAEQSHFTMANPDNVRGTFTNCRSKGDYWGRNTASALKLTGTTGRDTDGIHCTDDDYICVITNLSRLDTRSVLQYALVFHAEKRGSVIKFKHDLCRDSISMVACPPPNTVTTSFQYDVICYQPDPAWTAAHTPTIRLAGDTHTCEGLVIYQPETAFVGPAQGIVARAGQSFCR